LVGEKFQRGEIYPEKFFRRKNFRREEKVLSRIKFLVGEFIRGRNFREREEYFWEDIPGEDFFWEENILGGMKVRKLSGRN